MRPRPTRVQHPPGSAGSPAGGNVERRPGAGALVLLGVIAAGAWSTDQLTKAWAVAVLPLGEARPLVGELLQLRRTSNPGAAFSLASGATWVLSVVAAGVVVAVLVVARRLRSRTWAVALGLLLGGTLGNLTDRMLREPGGGHGHVVDFLELPHWPIFNAADMCIVTAAALICLLAFRGTGVDGSRPDPRPDTTDGTR